MKISYELAKELKDAGFPFRDTKYDLDQEEPNIPTLSELIEGCKEKTKTLKLFCNFVKDEYGVQLENQSLDDVVWYKTPEESIARLWLTLNKK